MNISGLANMQLQMGQLSQPASGSTSASGLMAPATKRVTQELESTNLKLSAFGQIKSAFGSAQTSADSLTTTATSKTATNADIEKAAQAFVAAYNQAAQSVTGATNASSPKAALTTDFRARAAGNDLARSLTGDNGLADLKQAGITRNKDGTLTLDTKALQSALQSNSAQTRNVLASAGQQVSSVAGKELAGTGNLGLSVDKLASRAKTLTAQQTSLQQQTATLQSKLEKQEATLTYSAAKSLAQYQSILG